jgi:hypothetical protein
VFPDGTGDFPTILQALNAAVDGDTVLLADGEFELREELGFHGARVVLRSESGDPARCILESHHEGPVIFVHNGESAETLIEGVTVRGGLNTEGGWGGGMLCYGASPTIRRCVFTDNLALSGGGICCYQSSSSIEDCLFEGNSAGESPFPGWGAGISVVGGSPRITGCRFIGNSSGSGGGIDVSQSNVVIEGCQVTGCMLGGICCVESAIDIRDCVVTGQYGGGVLLGRSNGTLAGVTIVGNRGYFEGGGLRIELGSSIHVVRCVVSGNCADPGFGNLYADPSSTAELVCCVMDSSGVGGGGTLVGLSETSFADPLFCAPEPCSSAPTAQGDYGVSGDSPCAAGNSPCGELIGAVGVDCSPPAVESRTWGAVKFLFK